MKNCIFWGEKLSNQDLNENIGYKGIKIWKK